MTRVTVVQPPGSTQAQRDAWVAGLPGWDRDSVAAVRRLIDALNKTAQRNQPWHKRATRPTWSTKVVAGGKVWKRRAI